jgi:hypothetical protein
MTGTSERTPSSVRAGGQCLLDSCSFFQGQTYALKPQFATIFFESRDYDFLLMTVAFNTHCLTRIRDLPRRLKTGFRQLSASPAPPRHAQPVGSHGGRRWPKKLRGPTGRRFENTASAYPPSAGASPFCATRKYQPQRPDNVMSWGASGRRCESRSLKQGARGWLTSRIASPQRKRSPMATAVSSAPSSVKFSPKVAGLQGSAFSRSHHGQ